jgi:hypothetical protein
MMSVPPDFPRFQVPGSETRMEALRQMFWLHFLPDGLEWNEWLAGEDGFPQYPLLPSGPKATLWDEWLCALMLWPGVETDGVQQRMQERWRRSLLERPIDPEGYVATLQGVFYAHNLGWPFPCWSHGSGGWGWHFSFKGQAGELGTRNGTAFRPPALCAPEGWSLQGAEDRGVDEWGWNLILRQPDAAAETPEREIDAFQSPFLQIRWRAPERALRDPCIEWTTDDQPQFSPKRRFYFEPPAGDGITFTMIPVYRHPLWKGSVRRIRICLHNAETDVPLLLQAFFTQYDTRHNINNLNYVRGCIHYFHWTRDLAFLRQNAARIRLALAGFLKEHHVREERTVLTDWIGHDGICRMETLPDGTRRPASGHGMPNNYWDILPFGHYDAYATVHLYDALNQMATLEREIREHPEWNIPCDPLALESEDLLTLAEQVRETGNRLYWNEATGRFHAGIDAEGRSHDYGFTALNLEAVHYGFASAEHAAEILRWIRGERLVEGDDSQGEDIYHWRFAPRVTTRRNRDYWYWTAYPPDDLPFGWSVQDGGAILGFSYYDLMARLRVCGAEDAWRRLEEILIWFEETQQTGGYAAYYASQKGALQGANVGGSLGIASEFFESVMVPQTILTGFLGFTPRGDGFLLHPRLPDGWSELTIDRIRWHGLTLKARVAHDFLEIYKQGRAEEPVRIGLPEGDWMALSLREGGTSRIFPSPVRGEAVIDWRDLDGVRFQRPKEPEGAPHA